MLVICLTYLMRRTQEPIYGRWKDDGGRAVPSRSYERVRESLASPKGRGTERAERAERAGLWHTAIETW